jgi:hypothetical protein
MLIQVIGCVFIGILILWFILCYGAPKGRGDLLIWLSFFGIAYVISSILDFFLKLFQIRRILFLLSSCFRRFRNLCTLRPEHIARPLFSLLHFLRIWDLIGLVIYCTFALLEYTHITHILAYTYQLFFRPTQGN